MRPATQNGLGGIERAGLARRRRARGLRGESGSALVELAFVVAFLATPLLLGSAAIGIPVYDSIEVTNAAAAGAAYAMQSSANASDTSGITSAARAEATDFGTSLTVTPTAFYVCSTDIAGTRYTGSSAKSDATSACTGGTNHALQFVEVTTRASVTPLVHITGLRTTFTLAGQSIMEVEQ